jgi:hypothetical protein
LLRHPVVKDYVDGCGQIHASVRWNLHNALRAFNDVFRHAPILRAKDVVSLLRVREPIQRLRAVAQLHDYRNRAVWDGTQNTIGFEAGDVLVSAHRVGCVLAHAPASHNYQRCPEATSGPEHAAKVRLVFAAIQPDCGKASHGDTQKIAHSHSLMRCHKVGLVGIGFSKCRDRQPAHVALQNVLRTASLSLVQ